MTFTQSELEDMARTALARAEADDADAEALATYHERNDEAVRLHEQGYPYPMSPGTASTSFAEYNATPAEIAATLLDRLEQLAGEARRRDGVGLVNDAVLAYDVQQDFRRLQAEAVLPAETVERFNAVIEEFEVMVGSTA